MGFPYWKLALALRETAFPFFGLGRSNPQIRAKNFYKTACRGGRILITDSPDFSASSGVGIEGRPTSAALLRIFSTRLRDADKASDVAGIGDDLAMSNAA